MIAYQDPEGGGADKALFSQSQEPSLAEQVRVALQDFGLIR